MKNPAPVGSRKRGCKEGTLGIVAERLTNGTAAVNKLREGMMLWPATGSR